MVIASECVGDPVTGAYSLRHTVLLREETFRARMVERLQRACLYPQHWAPPIASTLGALHDVQQGITRSRLGIRETSKGGNSLRAKARGACTMKMGIKRAADLTSRWQFAWHDSAPDLASRCRQATRD